MHSPQISGTFIFFMKWVIWSLNLQRTCKKWEELVDQNLIFPGGKYDEYHRIIGSPSHSDCRAMCMYIYIYIYNYIYIIYASSAGSHRSELPRVLIGQQGLPNCNLELSVRFVHWCLSKETQCDTQMQKAQFWKSWIYRIKYTSCSDCESCFFQDEVWYRYAILRAS